MNVEEFRNAVKKFSYPDVETPPSQITENAIQTIVNDIAEKILRAIEAKDLLVGYGLHPELNSTLSKVVCFQVQKSDPSLETLRWIQEATEAEREILGFIIHQLKAK